MSTQEWYEPTNEGVSPFDSSYTEEFRLPPERTEKELKSLEAIISVMPRKPRVLDIAGGFGRISSELVRRNLVESLVNLDLNEEFLHLAKGHGITEAVRGDMRSLGLKDRSFDLALIMFTSFGYFDEGGNFRVLQEAYRVLDNDGVLVLDLPNYSRISNNFSANREMPLKDGVVIKYNKRVEGKYLIEERSRIEGGQKPENLLPIKLRIYVPEEIVGLCRKAGFNKAITVDQELKEFSPNNARRLWVINTK